MENNIEHRAWREALCILNQGTVEGLALSSYTNHQESFLAEIRHSNEVFAAFKITSMSQRLAAKLYTPEGSLKSFDRWRRDVQGITGHYCRAWLQTEYDTAVIRAHQAADWQGFEANKDVMPNLSWMPTTSPTPESGHRAFWERKLTLPIDDPFWNKHRPGDRYNCKCSLEATDDPETPYEVDPDLPKPQSSHKGLENNPGKDGHIFSDKHPYFPTSCSACPFYKESKPKNLLQRIFRNQRKKDCHNCSYIDRAIDKAKIAEGHIYLPDKVYGDRLQISIKADPNDLKDNKRVAKALLDSFPDMVVKIRPHLRVLNTPNPELEINGIIAENKRITSRKGGVRNAFKDKRGQEYRTVVIDLDANDMPLLIDEYSKQISRRINDLPGKINECYFVYKGKVALITTREEDTVRKILLSLK